MWSKPVSQLFFFVVVTPRLLAATRKREICGMRKAYFNIWMVVMAADAQLLIQQQRTITIPALQSNCVDVSDRSNNVLCVVYCSRKTCKNIHLICPGRDNNWKLNISTDYNRWKWALRCANRSLGEVLLNALLLTPGWYSFINRSGLKMVPWGTP